MVLGFSKTNKIVIKLFILHSARQPKQSLTLPTIRVKRDIKKTLAANL